MKKMLAAWRHWREIREFDRAHKRGTPVAITTPQDGIKVHLAPDWIDDDSLSVAEKMRRFEALHPERTSGPLRLVTSPPTTTCGTTSTYIWRQA